MRELDLVPVFSSPRGPDRAARRFRRQEARDLVCVRRQSRRLSGGQRNCGSGDRYGGGRDQPAFDDELAVRVTVVTPNGLVG